MIELEITRQTLWIFFSIRVGVGIVIGIPVGIIIMQLLTMPKKVGSPVEAALKTVQYHKHKEKQNIAI